MPASAPVREFVDGLTRAKVPPGFHNPYVREEAAHNLGLFLTRRDMAARTVLLVGEAPGYKGALCSGVPFASVDIVTRPGDPWQAFGTTAGYMMPEWTRYRREATATITWKALAECFGDAPIPLTWNAVPFHPHDGIGPGNRSLAKAELVLGYSWLEWLLDLFPNVLPVAVGHRADEALKALGVGHRAVRHPSYGGKADFVSGLRAEALRVGKGER